MGKVSSNIFEKCLPAVSSDIDRCGSVTLCNIDQATKTDLDTIFGDGDTNKWTINEVLFTVDYEAKACQIKENSLYDLISTTRAAKPGRLPMEQLSKDVMQIRPFINVFRNGIINNKRWIASAGQSGGGSNWQLDLRAETGTNIPADTRWFPAGMRVFVEGRTTGGTETQTAYEVVSATNPTSTSVRVVLKPHNANSFLTSAELTSPVKGVLTRGLPNVNDYEAYCATDPGLNTRQQTPVWFETNRLSLCRDEIYEKYHALLRQNNPRYREYGDIETVQRNAQALENYRDSWINQWFFGKAEANQDMDNWQSLTQITIPTNATLNLPFEGRCMGYKASNIGIYEQLAQCNRIFQAQGRRLNLWDLCKHLYQIKRQREQQGGVVKRIDIFVDTFFKFQIQNALVAMFNTISGGAIRYPIQVVALGQNNLGFAFDTYFFPYPGVEVSFISHPFFDDRVAANIDATIDGATTAKRWMWILDFADVKTWMLGTNRVTNTSGTAQEVARVDSDAMCVMDRPRQTWEHTSQTWCNFLSCPASSSITVGLSPEQPVYAEDASANVYYDTDAAVP